jgi:hypothetical protein
VVYAAGCHDAVATGDLEQIAGTVAAKLKTETWRQPVLTPAVIKPHNRMLIDP